MKIVINKCYGGFGLSEVAFTRWKNQTGSTAKYDNEIKRNDRDLVEIVEELGEDSWGVYSELEIIDIPDDVKWHIAEYDGTEWIAEDHRTWS
jgi:hypothetical protein